MDWLVFIAARKVCEHKYLNKGLFSVCCPWVNVAEFADADVDRAEKQNEM